LPHAARTCSSVANSPRAAASREVAIAVRSPGEGDGRLFICAGKPKNRTGDIVLGVRRETAGGFKCLLKKFGHRSIVNSLCSKTTTKCKAFSQVRTGYRHNSLNPVTATIGLMRRKRAARVLPVNSE
jgi:hypothetical protein